MRKDMKARFISYFGLAVLLGTSVVSGQVLTKDEIQIDDRGDLYLKRGMTERAIKYWEAAGDSEPDGASYFKNFNLYFNGDFVEKNDEFAAFWLRKAASKGNAEAMYRLGDLHYRSGEESLINVEDGIYWWDLAAKRRHTASALELAQHYLYVDPNRNIVAARSYARVAGLRPGNLIDRILEDISNRIRLLNIQGARSLMQVDDSKFTLELLMTDSINSAWVSVVQNRLKNAFIYGNQRGAFYLTVGEFDSASQAIEYVSKVPEGLRQYNFRPVSIAAAKAELRARYAPNYEDYKNLDGAELSEQPPMSFTAELYRSDSRVDCLDFIDRYQLSNSRIFETYQGFFVVTAGTFNSADEAKAVINQLPQDLLQFQPAVRRYDQISSELRQAPVAELDYFGSVFNTKLEMPIETDVETTQGE